MSFSSSIVFEFSFIDVESVSLSLLNDNNEPFIAMLSSPSIDPIPTLSSIPFKSFSIPIVSPSILCMNKELFSDIVPVFSELGSFLVTFISSAVLNIPMRSLSNPMVPPSIVRITDAFFSDNVEVSSKSEAGALFSSHCKFSKSAIFLSSSTVASSFPFVLSARDCDSKDESNSSSEPSASSWHEIDDFSLTLLHEFKRP
mmetsp:Transcript_7428/g.11188  ORF Transcript_7428/g.11188 Transcript_7428/m.11188 type:complete len:200 (-) Transcript_7428:616-1215(-)